MNKFIFEKLEVYQKTLNFMGKIIDIVRELPSEIRYSIGNHYDRNSGFHGKEYCTRMWEKRKAGKETILQYIPTLYTQ